ncbi:UNVERIFIED_CONTAM: hypothetical protein GTU68_028447 [Idotea baltica]|nr:hypothetical protein [Idotea baltica]
MSIMHNKKSWMNSSSR